jgi:opacity protein-like surface antigen
MLNGYYQLFSFLRSDRQYYAIKVRNDSTYLLYDVDYTGTGVVKQEGNFKNILLFLCRNCPELKGKIDYLSFTDPDIINYLKALNRCVSPSTESDVVYKREKSKLNVFLYAGGMAYSDKHEITAKAIARFFIPGLDGKTSVNVGINYMQNFEKSLVDVYYIGYKMNQEVTVNMFSVPLSIQHNFTKGKIQPYIDAGLSLVYKKGSGAIDFGGRPIEERDKTGVGFTAAIGLDGNITKSLAIKAEWRYELLLHLPTVGIAYTFR